MNKNIIIAILVVIIIGAAAFMVFSQQNSANKIDTEFDVITDNTLSNGDQIQFVLKEKNGSAIAGEKVKIGFTDGAGNLETYEVTTDSNGKGALVLENEDVGSHNLTLAYDGNDKYNECSLTLTINVEDESDDSQDPISDANTANSNDPSSSNNTLPDNPQHWNYDNETGEYYLDDGTIVGDSQQAGGNIWEWKKLWEENGGDPYKDIS